MNLQDILKQIQQDKYLCDISFEDVALGVGLNNFVPSKEKLVRQERLRAYCKQTDQQLYRFYFLDNNFVAYSYEKLNEKRRTEWFLWASYKVAQMVKTYLLDLTDAGFTLNVRLLGEYEVFKDIVEIE